MCADENQAFGTLLRPYWHPAFSPSHRLTSQGKAKGEPRSNDAGAPIELGRFAERCLHRVEQRDKVERLGQETGRAESVRCDRRH